MPTLGADFLCLGCPGQSFQGGRISLSYSDIELYEDKASFPVDKVSYHLLFSSSAHVRRLRLVSYHLLFSGPILG